MFNGKSKIYPQKPIKYRYKIFEEIRQPWESNLAIRNDMVERHAPKPLRHASLVSRWSEFINYIVFIKSGIKGYVCDRYAYMFVFV